MAHTFGDYVLLAIGILVIWGIVGFFALLIFSLGDDLFDDQVDWKVITAGCLGGPFFWFIMAVELIDNLYLRYCNWRESRAVPPG